MVVVGSNPAIPTRLDSLPRTSETLPEIDIDPSETSEWLEALESVIRHGGPQRADELLSQMARRLATEGLTPSYNLTTSFRNSIDLSTQQSLAGDLHMERRIRSCVRWNALMMVMRANQAEPSLGGHIATYASSATLYEVGFNHFFRARSKEFGGDLIYFQGHAAPGIYARSFLEHRLEETDLDGFRREIAGGLSSYPHPWLMPDYWQYPTVSMGLGPIQGIYQAYIMRYLQARQLLQQDDRKVWVFCGDGEMDEPESLGAISMAGRENLDNLIFVINCNLQRLDGPVRGNGKIIQELEGVFRGAGWNVVKVVWGGLWDPLLSADRHGHLQKLMDEVVDGEMQNFKSKGGAYTRKNFFGQHPETEQMVAHMSDAEIYRLNRGGHDPSKVFAAYAAAQTNKGSPTVVLALTVKGYGLGAFESENRTHQAKKLTLKDLSGFRDRFNLPISDEDLPNLPYYRPPEDSAEHRYMMERRERLGGSMPQRLADFESLPAAAEDYFSSYLDGGGEREASTTMVYVRILNSLVKDKNFGELVVPIVPDEARTFGMEGMFRTLGIYSAQGQLYEPQDMEELAPYRESADGIMLEEGITEAGAFSAWLALATAYSSYARPMLPFYTFYSMFGFQRIQDLAWAAGDAQARGFLVGATSGRTTLNGEGLQHQDGHSHLLAATIPNCVSYDPAFAGELAVILESGLDRMYRRQEPVFFYITVSNESYRQPPIPKNAREGIVRGLYLFRASGSGGKSARAGKKNTKKLKDTMGPALRVRLIGAGAILNEVLAAADILAERYGIQSDVFSATSLTELRRTALEVERQNRLHPDKAPTETWVEQCLAQGEGPVIAATDYMKALADGIRQWVHDDYTALGTDGFGRSDTRAALRRFFEVDRWHIVANSLSALARTGAIDAAVAEKEIAGLKLDRGSSSPARN